MSRSDEEKTDPMALMAQGKESLSKGSKKDKEKAIEFFDKALAEASKEDEALESKDNKSSKMSQIAEKIGDIFTAKKDAGSRLHYYCRAIKSGNTSLYERLLGQNAFDAVLHINQPAVYCALMAAAITGGNIPDEVFSPTLVKIQQAPFNEIDRGSSEEKALFRHVFIAHSFETMQTMLPLHFDQLKEKFRNELIDELIAKMDNEISDDSLNAAKETLKKLQNNYHHQDYFDDIDLESIIDAKKIKADPEIVTDRKASKLLIEIENSNLEQIRTLLRELASIGYNNFPLDESKEGLSLSEENLLNTILDDGAKDVFLSLFEDKDKGKDKAQAIYLQLRAFNQVREACSQKVMHNVAEKPYLGKLALVLKKMNIANQELIHSHPTKTPLFRWEKFLANCFKKLKTYFPSSPEGIFTNQKRGLFFLGTSTNFKKAATAANEAKTKFSETLREHKEKAEHLNPRKRK